MDFLKLAGTSAADTVLEAGLKDFGRGWAEKVVYLNLFFIVFSELR